MPDPQTSAPPLPPGYREVPAPSTSNQPPKGYTEVPAPSSAQSPQPAPDLATQFSSPPLNMPSSPPMSEEAAENIGAAYRYSGLEGINKLRQFLGQKVGHFSEQLAGGFPEEFNKIANDPTQSPEVRQRAQAQLASYQKESQVARGAAMGVGEIAGGMVGDPANWPFLAAGEVSPLLQKLISGGFGVMMGNDAINQAMDLKENWSKYSTEQRAEKLSQIGIGGTMATAAGTHVMLGSNGGVVRLDPEEHSYLQGVIQQHLEQGLEEGDLTKVDEATASNKVINAKPKLSDQEARALAPFLSRYPKQIADLTAKYEAGDEEAGDQLRTLLQGTRKGGAYTGPPEGQKERRYATTVGLPEVQENAPSAEVQPLSAGGIGGTRETPNAPEGGVETLRDDTGTPRGEGTVSADALLSAQQGGDRGEGTEGVTNTVESKVAALSTLVPEFTKAATIGGGTSEGAPPSRPATPSVGEELPPNNVDSPPVISEAADNDLANGGIQVVRGGKDISFVARYLGSIIETARRFNNPILNAIANRIADVSIAIARNTKDSISGFRKEVRANVNPAEWDQTVNLLNDPNVTIATLDPTLPYNIKGAYTFARNLLDQHRLQAINAKRLEMIAGGMTSAKAKLLVPDDWGIKEGYYAHAFPGNWTITEHGGVDAKGKDIWNAIDTGWRATTLSEAQARARAYLDNNPNSNLKVELDNVTLQGRGISDRNRLQALHDEIKASSTYIHNGANPDGVLSDLSDTSAKLTYGPRRPTPRSFGQTMERESNLPGWARDMDNFERYIVGMERYTQLAPARAELLKYRNMLAQQTGMPDILKPGEIPKRYSGNYANMLGRVDAAIEGLEGYPTGVDSAIRNTLQKMGHDPNLVNNAYSTINSVEALLKLGFNPASAGLHLAQTLAATYPVLGERYTAHGILNAYSSRYQPLVHDLGIEATSNLLDIDSFQAYKGGYLGGVTGPITLAKAGYKALQDTGLFMFSKGVETARRVSAIGAYEKAIDAGKSPQEARDYARDVMNRTQFNYSPADQSIVMRNIPRPMGQFKNFTVKMAEFIYGLRGAEIPRFMAAMGVIGYAGLPALQGISNAIQWATGYNPENEFKRAFPRFSRGALGYVGIDYTKNIGFGDWLGGHSLDIPHLLGPAASDLLNAGKGGIAEIKELAGSPSRTGATDIDNSLRNISPEIRRLWDEGLRIAREPNLTDPKTGSIILKNLSPAERIEMLAGLTPLRVSEEKESHEYIRNQIEAAKDKRGYFVDKLAENQLELARPGLTPEQKADLFKETISLQKLAISYGQGAHLPQAVRERMKAMIQDRLTRDVKGAPKAERSLAFQELQRAHGVLPPAPPEP
jgi:hypothetical protein